MHRSQHKRGHSCCISQVRWKAANSYIVATIAFGMGLDIRHILAPHIILNHISKKLGDVDLVYISISLNLTRLDALGGSVKSAFKYC